MTIKQFIPKTNPDLLGDQSSLVLTDGGQWSLQVTDGIVGLVVTFDDETEARQYLNFADIS